MLNQQDRNSQNQSTANDEGSDDMNDDWSEDFGGSSNNGRKRKARGGYRGAGFKKFKRAGYILNYS